MRRVIVYHSHYGCQTGCCGHTVEVGDGPFETGLGAEESFEFDHFYPEGRREPQTPLAFAQALVAQAYGDDHVADLDWDACLIEDHGGVVYEGKDFSW